MNALINQRKWTIKRKRIKSIMEKQSKNILIFLLFLSFVLIKPDFPSFVIGASSTAYNSKISSSLDDAYEKNGQMVNKQTIDMGK